MYFVLSSSCGCSRIAPLFLECSRIALLSSLPEVLVVLVVLVWMSFPVSDGLLPCVCTVLASWALRYSAYSSRVVVPVVHPVAYEVDNAIMTSFGCNGRPLRTQYPNLFRAVALHLGIVPVNLDVVQEVQVGNS